MSRSSNNEPTKTGKKPARRGGYKTLEEYLTDHDELDARLKAYLVSDRGQHADAGQLLEEIKDRSARSRFATNRAVRKKYQTLFHAAFEEMVTRCPTRRFWFVTLTPEQFSMPWERARFFDHAELIGWAKTVLKGFHYIGVVEGALYTAGPGPISHSRYGWVSFHVHLQVWSCSEQKIQGVVAEVNARHRSLVPGIPAGHVRKVANPKVASHWGYPMKLPYMDYRAYRSKSRTKPTGKQADQSPYQQPKRPASMPVLVRAMKALHGRTMPSLLFAGKKGKRVLSKVNLQAMMDLALDDLASGQALKRTMATAGLLNVDPGPSLPDREPRTGLRTPPEMTIADASRRASRGYTLVRLNHASFVPLRYAMSGRLRLGRSIGFRQAATSKSGRPVQ